MSGLLCKLRVRVAQEQAVDATLFAGDINAKP